MSYDHLHADRSFVLAGTERVYERPRPFCIDHIALDWTIDHAGKSLRGTATLELGRIDPDASAVLLDAVGFEVESVAVLVEPGRRSDALFRGAGAERARRAHRENAPWRPASYSYDGERLRVPLPTTVRRAALRVSYRAQPVRGMYFLAPDREVPGRERQLWTQCQDEDARRLFPCHDKPHIRQTMELAVRVEPGWFALSNGERVSSRAEQRQGLFRYRMRLAIPSYLFTLVAGEFDCIEEQAGAVTLAYYFPRGRQLDARRSFARTADMIALYEQRTGVPYPWGRYAQIVVQDFIFGGMENTGATTLYEHVLLDERAALDVSSDDLIAHELAHQWFGNLVTCRDWSHAWLNEGFATFLEHVYREHHLGRDEYFLALADDLAAYLAEADGRYHRPVVCHDYEAPIEVFDRHLYQKGALVLHALRVELGDDMFWRGVRHYLERHAGNIVETRDLERAFEEVSGRGLERFFDQALHRPGHPRLDVTIEHDGRLLVVSVKQTLAADTAPYVFDLDLDIALPGPRGRRGAEPSRAPKATALVRERRTVAKAVETFVLPLGERPRFVVVDPELRVIGRVAVKAPADMLRNQLAEAPSGRARVLAAQALGKHEDPATLRALGEVLQSPRAFWGLRAAAAGSLGRIRSSEALGLLLGASRARHPKVRRAVVRALGEFREPEASARLARLAEHDESVLVAASASRALGSTRATQAFELLCRLLERPSWADVLRVGAIDGLGELRDERAVPVLEAQARYGLPTRARRAAVGALARLTTARATRESIEDMLADPSPLLRCAVVEALGEMGEPKSRSALLRGLDREHDGRVRRRLREVLRDLGARGRNETRRLREDLDELRRRGDELRARLAKVEARLGKGAGPDHPLDATGHSRRPTVRSAAKGKHR